MHYWQGRSTVDYHQFEFSNDDHHARKEWVMTANLKLITSFILRVIEYGILGEGSQNSTNQKQESTVSSPLIGWNLRAFPENFVLYWLG